MICPKCAQTVTLCKLNNCTGVEIKRRLVMCPECSNLFGVESLSPEYADLKAKHEKVLEMLLIAEKSLSRIAGPKKKDNTYFYTIPQIQQMGDDAADTQMAREALEQIERLKK